MTSVTPRPSSAHSAQWLDSGEFPGAGRGIVICAGGMRMFTNAYVLVRHLRTVLASTLPIEVWHLGKDEMSGAMRAILEAMDVKVVDAFAELARFPARISDGWQLKPYALIRSGFAQVLMLDADNLPTIDPAAIFDWPQFAGTGAVFWPDALDLSAQNPIWSELGMEPAQRVSFETGQMLVDKARHRAALAAVLHLNEDAERFYRLVYGDKDTFLAGWLMTGAPHSLVPHRPFADRHVFYQRDFSGEIVFQHRTNAKWSYDGSQPRPEAFRFAAECDASLAELRRIWNGRLFEPPLRPAAARAVERDIEGTRFVASRPGEADREVELLPYHQIGRGRDFDRENWHVAEPESGRFVLCLVGRRGLAQQMERREDGCWREAAPAQIALSLAPVSPAGNKDRREDPFLRDLVASVLAPSGWTPGAEAELRAALTALCRLDPRLAADLAAHVDRLDGQRPETAGLRAIAADLRRFVANLPRRAETPARPELLSDWRYYTRP